MEEETYQAERRQLLEFQLNQAGFFDRGILTLSAAALGLSLAFMKEIVPETKLETFWMLYSAWAGFIASLLITLASFQVSQTAIRKAIENLDQIHAGETEGDIHNLWGSAVVAMNWFSLIAFVVGSAFLAFFVLNNIKLKG